MPSGSGKGGRFGVIGGHWAAMIIFIQRSPYLNLVELRMTYLKTQISKSKIENRKSPSLELELPALVTPHYPATPVLARRGDSSTMSMRTQKPPNIWNTQHCESFSRSIPISRFQVTNHNYCDFIHPPKIHIYTSNYSQTQKPKHTPPLPPALEVPPTAYLSPYSSPSHSYS